MRSFVFPLLLSLVDMVEVVKRLAVRVGHASEAGARLQS